jgi:hypothetical protein
MTGLGLAAALALATAAAPDASPDQIDTAVTAVPQAFADCAAAYAKRLEADEAIADRFDCAQKHFERHPGFDGSTYETATAAVHAAAVANLYVDEKLVPALEERLAGDGPGDMTRTLLLRGFVRSRRASDEAECDLYYDWFSAGTIRSVVGAGCALGNADDLVETLLRFQAASAAN